MKDFVTTSSRNLEDLASMLESSNAFPGIKRLEATFGRTDADTLHQTLMQYQVGGWMATQVAYLIRTLAKDRLERDKLWSWVISGPSQDGVPTRDTGVVYRSLVQEATREILLTSFALHRGKELFEPLYERMTAITGLKVTMVLDISRPWQDTSVNEAILARFLKDFNKKHWPWKLKPELWYFPKALALDPAKKAVLHAKTVIIDRSVALVTSANLTHAAQEKNIEAGVMVRDPEQAEYLQRFFEGLMLDGHLQRAGVSPY